MIINVRLFALSREITGQTSFDHTLPDDATLADFTEWLYKTYPSMQALRLQFAVNMVYAPLDIILKEGDEIACIPPVGGG
jgi:molybdopterin converting factor subunit 1